MQSFTYKQFLKKGFPCSSAGKQSTCNAGDPSWIPGSRRSPREGNGCPLQCSGLDSIQLYDSTDCILHGVAKNWTRLSNFPILLFSSVSLHWLLKKASLSLLAILWNSAFRCFYLSFSPWLFPSLLFTAICEASPDSHFAFLYFFSMGMVLIPGSCTMSQTSFHSSSGTLSIRSRPLNLFLTFTV